jgi:hypothetical protein
MERGVIAVMKSTFKGLLASEEVNTGRQIEFDYSKGLFLFAILFIHAFQLAGRGAGMDAAAYKIIYIIGSMTGASIFIFVLGLGTRYRKAGVGEMLRSGRRLVIYQYLNNAAWVASAVLPYFVLQIFKDMSANKDEVIVLSILFALYINIFFLAGGIYLLLAFLHKLKIPVWLYVVLGLTINIFSPMLIGLNTGFAPADYILGGIFGGTPHASFSILNYLPYALFGAAFGDLLKRVTDKKRFYSIICSFSVLLLLTFFVWALWKYPDIDSLYGYIGRTYTKPDSIRTIANTSAVMLLAGILFFMSKMIAGLRYIHRTLMYYSKNISKYYAIHPVFAFLAYGFNGYKSFGFWGCFTLFIVTVVFTDVFVRLYNRVLGGTT